MMPLAVVCRGERAQVQVAQGRINLECKVDKFGKLQSSCAMGGVAVAGRWFGYAGTTQHTLRCG